MVKQWFVIATGTNENCRALTDVRFHGIFPWVKQQWRDLSKKFIIEKDAITRKHVLYNSIADILRNIVYIGVLIMAASEIYNNPAIGLGTFMLIYTLSGQLQTTTTNLFVGIARVFGDIGYMKDFFDMQSTPKEKLEDNIQTLKKADIEYKNVSFIYPNSEIEALKNVSISINQGEKIAIVGENGSGKSTFINLLCGMYEPTEGSVSVNSKIISEQLGSVRRAISVVFQSFCHFESTIRENITISEPNKKVSDNVINDIIKKAHAEAVIKEQPNGLDEIVGTFSKSGNNLSGGQWQKIAIARAIYRDQAKVLVLDEPTAALDPIAEAQLYNDFTALSEDKTTILISHRLGITSIVDRVLVFKEGKLIGDGNHKDLVNNCPYYAQMYSAQAQWYQ